MVSYIKWMVNEYNKVSQLINHPPNVINTILNFINHDCQVINQIYMIFKIVVNSIIVLCGWLMGR